MSVNPFLRMPRRNRNAGAGMTAPLWLVVAVALGGCAGTASQTGSGTQTAAAGPETLSCEQQHNMAVQQCRQNFDPMSSATTDQLMGCRTQVLQAYQECRDKR
jgi:hypothetical protein